MTTATPRRPRADVLQTTVGGCRVIHDPVASTTHVLDAAAASVWDHLLAAATGDELVAAVAAEWSVPATVVEADVLRAVERFAGLGLTEATSARPRRDEIDPSVRPVGRVNDRVLERTTGGRRAGRLIVEVRSDDPLVVAVASAAMDALPETDEPGHVIAVTRADEPSGPRWAVVVDGIEVAEATSAEDAVVVARAETNRLVVEHSDGFLRLHAAAVERDGEVVVLVGASGRGKSTLAAALVGRGFRYLGDEVVAIAADTWTVEPFPKHLDLDACSRASLQITGVTESPRKVPVSPRLLGDVSAGGEVRLLVLLDADADADADDGAPAPDPPRRIPAIEALIEVLDSTFRSTMDEPGALDALGRLVTEVPTVRLPRRSIPAAVATIDHALTAAISAGDPASASA